ncbi:AIR synthase-related protein [Halobacterium sp. R2-5]|uniref:AIR synthase family protein n=1 Tax=Halobacterium sp. R2-5 TaxID=2715751 RepID=UPI00142205C9|nr:AIR synthase-related protein [Halobacterium sp. R2-5]NIB98572.1 hydrogenase expression protein [Halobacterium sp. R2-5]
MDSGKASRRFFEDHVAGRTGADRGDVRLGPTYGADFGVVDVGDSVVAMATDPVFVLRDLGLERAAWFAFHICVSDVSLSGLPPAHLAVNLNLPPDTSTETFDAVWEVFDREAEKLGTSLTTGHTGTYEGCSFPTVGAATALSVGDRADLVVPTGSRPGDRVVVTKGPAIETTGLLGVLFGDDLPIGEDAAAAARERFEDVSPVRDALTAAAAGRVTAMHDATERGLANAFHELAAAGGVSLAVERDRVPVLPGVREVCEYFDIDPWTSSSEGTVVATVAPGDVDAVLAALDSEGVPAAEVGRVEEAGGARVTADGDPLPEPESDPLWAAYQTGRERFRGE